MVLISNSQGKYTVVRVCLIMSRICLGCLSSMTFNQGLRPLFLSYQEIGGLGQILRANRLYCFPIATMVKASRFVHDGQNILMAHMSNFYDKDPPVRACLTVFIFVHDRFNQVLLVCFTYYGRVLRLSSYSWQVNNSEAMAFLKQGK